MDTCHFRHPLRTCESQWIKVLLCGLISGLVWPLACIDLTLPEIDVPIDLSLVNGGSSFVLRGTAVLIDNDGPCPVWIGDNGVTYHLFQAPQLENDIFDLVTSPGTTSRLVLTVRGDLEVACQLGEIAEVRDALEIVE